MTGQTGLSRFVRPPAPAAPAPARAATPAPPSPAPPSPAPPSPAPATAAPEAVTAPAAPVRAAPARPAAPPGSAGSGPPGLAAVAMSPEAAAAMGLLPSMPGRAPQQSGQPADAPERCELCATEVASEHGHIADLDGASLLCACRACYLLFTQQAAGRGRYRAVPDRYLHDPGRVITPAEWDQLEIPGRPGVLPAHLARGRRPHRVLPQPGGRDRMHPGPAAVGAPGRRVPAARRAGGGRRGGTDQPDGFGR